MTEILWEPCSSLAILSASSISNMPKPCSTRREREKAHVWSCYWLVHLQLVFIACQRCMETRHEWQMGYVDVHPQTRVD